MENQWGIEAGVAGLEWGVFIGAAILVWKVCWCFAFGAVFQ
jgi:hypothetical protein